MAASPLSRCKLFVSKILTSNPLELKILHSVFVRAAPVAAFRGYGGGGTYHKSHYLPKRTLEMNAIQC